MRKRSFVMAVAVFLLVSCTPIAPRVSPHLPTPSMSASKAPGSPLAQTPTSPAKGNLTSTVVVIPSSSATYLAPTPETGVPVYQVETLLEQMTLEEKVGQLLLVHFTGPGLSPDLVKMITEYHVGGILLFTSSGNVESSAQLVQLINGAQHEAVTHGSAIPLLVALDQEGGPVVRLPHGATVMPSNMAIGATGSTENARLAAEVTAAELNALGINMNLAPVLDVNNNPDNPVIGIRSFGSTPDVVARFGNAAIDAYQSNGIVATAKHFPGHGNTSTDSHLSLPTVPHNMADLEEVELVPFQAAIDSGVPVVMTAHLLMPALEPSPGVPASMSALVLQDLLRDQMSFEGVIVTDSLGMGAVSGPGDVTDAALSAFEAGTDLLAFGADRGHTPKEQIPVFLEILQRVQSGDISEARLDQSVRRILTVKFRYGIMEWEPVDVELAHLVVGSPDHLEIARQIGLDSITLVRNARGLLPVESDRRLLVVWPQGFSDMGGVLGSYSSDAEILPVSLDPTTDEIDLVHSRAAEGVVIMVGTYDARRHPGQATLVQSLAQHPLVVVATGVPYDLLSYPDVETYLVTYGTASASIDGLAQVLFGLEEPKGGLPVTLPGMYPVGHGLTDFQ